MRKEKIILQYALLGIPYNTIKPPVPPSDYSSIKIYPNPVYDNLSIELSTYSKRYELVVHNLLGEIVLRKKEDAIIQFKITLPLE